MKNCSGRRCWNYRKITMDFKITKEQKMILKNVREFTLKEISPVAEEIDRNDEFPPDIWKKLGQIDLLGLSISEKYGGSGYDTLTFTLAVEQIAKVCPALAMSCGPREFVCS